MTTTQQRISLPRSAHLSVNRCNLPASILGSLTFQAYPQPLIIDGIEALYIDIFERLERLGNPVVRSKHFINYLSLQFNLDHPEEAGLVDERQLNRSKATYLRLIRGWLFDSDSIDGAVLKGWAESRFGLLPRYHRGPIRDPNEDQYTSYIQEWANGLYNTNALESQMDLVFSYCQFELGKKYRGQSTLTLYRGVNRLNAYESFGEDAEYTIALLNNLNSFTTNRERADEFGDYVLEVEVPLSKIVFYNALLPGVLTGEEEYIALGGLYKVKCLY